MAKHKAEFLLNDQSWRIILVEQDSPEFATNANIEFDFQFLKLIWHSQDSPEFHPRLNPTGELHLISNGSWKDARPLPLLLRKKKLKIKWSYGSSTTLLEEKGFHLERLFMRKKRIYGTRENFGEKLFFIIILLKFLFDIK